MVAGHGGRGQTGHVLTLAGEDEPLELAPTDLLVETQQREGFAVEQDRGVVVALDTTLTDELRAGGPGPRPGAPDPGYAQGCRVCHQRPHPHHLCGRAATAGPTGCAPPWPSTATMCKAETLSLDLREGPAPGGSHHADHTLDGATVTLAVQQADGRDTGGA